jgi:hypothetical protein
MGIEMKKMKNIANIKCVRVYDTSGNQDRLIALFADKVDAQDFVDISAEKRALRSQVKGGDQTVDYWVTTFRIDEKPMAIHGSFINVAFEAYKADVSARQAYPRPFSKKLKYWWNCFRYQPFFGLV